MAGARIVVVDSGERTAGLLADELARRGFGPVQVVEQAAALPPLLAAEAVGAVIVNHRYQQDDLLGACTVVKRLASDCATLVTSSSGPAIAQRWSRRRPARPSQWSVRSRGSRAASTRSSKNRSSTSGST